MEAETSVRIVRTFGCYVDDCDDPILSSCSRITQPALREVRADIVFTSFPLAHRQLLAAVVALMYVGGNFLRATLIIAPRKNRRHP